MKTCMFAVTRKKVPSTTYFDMTVLTILTGFILFQDVVNRLPKLGTSGAKLKKLVQDKLIEHRQYIDKHGQECPKSEIGNGVTKNECAKSYSHS